MLSVAKHKYFDAFQIPLHLRVAGGQDDDVPGEGGHHQAQAQERSLEKEKYF